MSLETESGDDSGAWADAAASPYDQVYMACPAMCPPLPGMGIASPATQLTPVAMPMSAAPAANGPLAVAAGTALPTLPVAVVPVPPAGVPAVSAVPAVPPVPAVSAVPAVPTIPAVPVLAPSAGVPHTMVVAPVPLAAAFSPLSATMVADSALACPSAGYTPCGSVPAAGTVPGEGDLQLQHIPTVGCGAPPMCLNGSVASKAAVAPWCTMIPVPVPASAIPLVPTHPVLGTASFTSRQSDRDGDDSHERSGSTDVVPWSPNVGPGQQISKPGQQSDQENAGRQGEMASLSMLCSSADSRPARWGTTAPYVGDVSEDGHELTKTTVGPRKYHDNGTQLSTLCMIFERDLREGGIHSYTYTILEGDVGAADGVGFVFDNKIRRNNIQKMRSVFLNRHGKVCVRDQTKIWKYEETLPRLACGTVVKLVIDLDASEATFVVVPSMSNGKRQSSFHRPCSQRFANELAVPGAGCTQVNFGSVFEKHGVKPPRCGFFAAVVTGAIKVSLS